MTNTQKRILSAFVMIGIVAIAYSIGKVGVEVLILTVSGLCFFEFSANFLKIKFLNIFSIINFCLLLAVQIWGILSPDVFSHRLIPIAGCLVNLVLLGYLFLSSMESNAFINTLKRVSILGMIMLLVPFMNLYTIVNHSKWQSLVIILLVFNFGMDTGAWFFGRNFGKHKLWKEVSPNKTIEGLIGGAFTSAVLGSSVWYYLLGDFEVKYILIFFSLGALSQIGDLIQSKIKRQVGVKDSSNLIPGHGGIYDRVDSLLFVIPFYTLLLSYNIL